MIATPDSKELRRLAERTDGGPVTPDQVRRALDDRLSRLEDPQIRDELYFGGLAGREVEQEMYGVSATPLSGAGEITGQTNISIDARLRSKLITEDGVQALQLANNIGDTDPCTLDRLFYSRSSAEHAKSSDGTTDLGS